MKIERERGNLRERASTCTYALRHCCRLRSLAGSLSGVSLFLSGAVLATSSLPLLSFLTRVGHLSGATLLPYIDVCIFDQSETLLSPRTNIRLLVLLALSLSHSFSLSAVADFGFGWDQSVACLGRDAAASKCCLSLSLLLLLRNVLTNHILRASVPTVHHSCSFFRRHHQGSQPHSTL